MTAAAHGPGVAVTTLPPGHPAAGVRIITEAMPDVRSVTVGFWVNCGSRDERGAAVGASHFLEHLLFKGTARRSAAQIAAEIDAVGGDLNAFTSKEYTCFYARCLDRDAALAVDVLGDMITSATIRAADVDGERDVVLEEIRMHLDTPDDLVHSVFSEAYFGAHPLGREVLGTEQTITAMSRAQVTRYYRRHYVPANLVVAVAGNVVHDEIVALVAGALGRDADAGGGGAGWLQRTGAAPGGSTATARSAPPAAPQAQAVLRRRPTEQVHAVFGGPGLARNDPRRYAAAVLNQALGGGMASRLFQEVRERRGLAYSVYSYQDMHNDSGAFAVYAGTGARRAKAVLDVVRAEFEAVLSGGLRDEELARARSSLAGATVLALEDTGSRMTRLGKSLVTGSPLQGLDETIAALEGVTAEEVAAVAMTLLAGPFTLALVGPVGRSAPATFDRYVQPLAA